MKTSQAQERFLAVLETNGGAGYRTPFTGGRDAGRVANAWYRTAAALEKMGLVVVERDGDARRAWLVEDAPDWVWEARKQREAQMKRSFALLDAAMKAGSNS